jgi:ribonucleoside-diphosphate reductase alpha chain
MRERLPDTRRSLTHKGVMWAEREVCPHCGKETRESLRKFFFTVGFYPDGRPGEVFMHMDESGSTLDGFADAWATAVSVCLQAGVPLEQLARKFEFQDFQPAGPTEDPVVRRARSVVDYVMRWMLNNTAKEETTDGQETRIVVEAPATSAAALTGMDGTTEHAGAAT